MQAVIGVEARRFLERQRVAHLATSSASGRPHVVPVCFALIGSTVYVPIDEKPKRNADSLQLRRLRNIADNARVAIVSDVYDDHDWSQLAFVLMHCRARVLSSGAEHSRALIALRDKYPQYRAMALETRPVIAADIECVSTWGQLTP